MNPIQHRMTRRAAAHDYTRTGIYHITLHVEDDLGQVLGTGFPDRFHPSAERLSQCMAGRLLLISPWRYQYRGKEERVSVPFCKTMNCVAQALCRCKDSWWKN